MNIDFSKILYFALIMTALSLIWAFVQYMRRHRLPAEIQKTAFSPKRMMLMLGLPLGILWLLVLNNYQNQPTSRPDIVKAMDTNLLVNDPSLPLPILRVLKEVDPLGFAELTELWRKEVVKYPWETLPFLERRFLRFAGEYCKKYVLAASDKAILTELKTELAFLEHLQKKSKMGVTKFDQPQKYGKIASEEYETVAGKAFIQSWREVLASGMKGEYNGNIEGAGEQFKAFMKLFVAKKPQDAQALRYSLSDFMTLDQITLFGSAMIALLQEFTNVKEQQRALMWRKIQADHLPAKG